jgi:hypothetical protein
VAPVAIDHAQPPYAYVVDYRPLDACSPPRCKIKARSASGFAKDTQPDGDPGAYVTAGSGIDTELYYRRGVVLRPTEAYEFVVPAAAAAQRELDAYLSSADGGRAFRARVAMAAVRPASGPGTPVESTFDGTTAPFAQPRPDTEGKGERFFRHVRAPLPGGGEMIRVTIENVGASKLAVGAPLVMRRVEGRGPRQIVFALFDAVPFHLLDAMLRGDTGEAKTAWLKKEIDRSGVYFPDAVSPGQCTTAFFSRFVTGQMWAGRGWPGMYGTGAIDESLPDVIHGPFARLAEEGFRAELAGNNFTIAPHLALTGLDAGYQIDTDTHATAMERHVASWTEHHPHDDAMLVLWNAQTHSPYPPGRDSSPAPLPPELPRADVNEKPNTAVWRNLTDGVDHLDAELRALRRAAPDADRIVWIGADHSRGVSLKMKRRAYRGLRGFGVDLSHGGSNTPEEMRAPYALIFDGPTPPQLTTRVARGVSSTIAVWRAVEDRFGLDLGLTASTMFDHPLFAGARVAAPWVDGLFVAPGMSGSIRAIEGSLAYGLFSPILTDSLVWSLRSSEQRVMLGAPARDGVIVSEELYDDATDPYELTDVASRRFDDVLRIRREVVDFVATHYDPPDHPRNVYTLQLPERTELRIASLGKVRVLVDDEAVPSSDPRSAVVTASRVEIVETEDPLGVVEIAALDRKLPVVLRCAANGLALDQVSEDRPRLALALARTNCPLPATGREVARPGEILFSFRKASLRDLGVAAAGVPVAGRGGQGGVGDDLLAGMKRWGYVRDIDENKP